jgi:hypothetical protein
MYPLEGTSLDGLTIREHYECEMMAGLCANPDVGRYAGVECKTPESGAEELATMAIMCADALLAAQEKRDD